MIDNIIQIDNLFQEIDLHLNTRVNIYLIGGVVLLTKDLRKVTKDIDAIVASRKSYLTLKKVFTKLLFTESKPTKEYSRLNLSQIFIRKDYRVDLFENVVCKQLALSKNMISRAKLYKKYNYISVYFCSDEDIFIFKSITDRGGDVIDCIGLAEKRLNWKIILNEIKYQIKLSGNEIWITFFEERLNLMEDKGLVIPIIKEVRKLSEKYYLELEKQLNNK